MGAPTSDPHPQFVTSVGQVDLKRYEFQLGNNNSGSQIYIRMRKAT